MAASTRYATSQLPQARESVSSAMKRVESSKEAGRNLVVIDSDGSTEWQSVSLTPPDWYYFKLFSLSR